MKKQQFISGLPQKERPDGKVLNISIIMISTAFTTSFTTTTTTATAK